MKELGNKLKSLRKKNGVTLEEASIDLNINIYELESLENGNFKAFKDVYELKKYIKLYSKYLGLSEEVCLDEFNDYLFEKTSKIKLSDLKKVDDSEENRICSPYTKIKPSKYDYAPVLMIVALLLFISFVVYISLLVFKTDNKVSRELVIKEIIYENYK